MAYLRKAKELVVNSTNGFLDSLLERAPNAHNLSDRLHARAEQAADTVELLEVPARDLNDTIIETRLEARAGDARDGVADLVERDAETKLRGDERERVAGRLGRKCGGTRQTCVDLDDAVLLGSGVERVLDVALADDAQVADDVDRGRAEHIVIAVGQRLGRRDDDRVTCVDAQRVEVLITSRE